VFLLKKTQQHNPLLILLQPCKKKLPVLIGQVSVGHHPCSASLLVLVGHADEPSRSLEAVCRSLFHVDVERLCSFGFGAILAMLKRTLLLALRTLLGPRLDCKLLAGAFVVDLVGGGHLNLHACKSQ
jgi:hypothetical protein